MSNRIFRQLFWVGAVVALIIGTVMTILSVWQMDKVSLRLGAKLDNLNELRAMEREIGRYVGAQQAFEQLAHKHPVSLMDLLKGILPGHKADDTREIRKESIPGWMVRQTEIASSQVPLGKLMEFVYMAEMGNSNQKQQPPWRLIKCVIKASSQAAGSGQVVLLLEALEKSHVME